MATSDFTTTILVDQSPAEAFNAVTNPRGWWSEEIEGGTEKLNDEFNYHFEDIHRCHVKLVEVIPGKKVVWYVTDNYFKPGIFGDASHEALDNEKLSKDQTEWTGTKMIFEISERDNKTLLRFTHEGLTPEYECFEVCVNSWTHYIKDSLFGLITTGKGLPNATGTPMTTDEEKFHSAAN
nr:SRPBCC domain-containing protein [uncultured Mucilaginibacter sp.]